MVIWSDPCAASCAWISDLTIPKPKATPTTLCRQYQNAGKGTDKLQTHGGLSGRHEAQMSPPAESMMFMSSRVVYNLVLIVMRQGGASGYNHDLRINFSRGRRPEARQEPTLRWSVQPGGVWLKVERLSESV